MTTASILQVHTPDRVVQQVEEAMVTARLQAVMDLPLVVVEASNPPLQRNQVVEDCGQSQRVLDSDALCLRLHEAATTAIIIITVVITMTA